MNVELSFRDRVSKLSNHSPILFPPNAFKADITSGQLTDKQRTTPAMETEGDVQKPRLEDSTILQLFISVVERIALGNPVWKHTDWNDRKTISKNIPDEAYMEFKGLGKI